MNTFVKTTIAAVIAASASLTSVSASAEQVDITGATDLLAAGCSFLNLQDGAMSWSEVDHYWTTDNDARVKMKTREVLNITVDNQKELKDSLGVADNVDSVDYAASSFQDTSARYAPSATVGANSYTVSDLGAVNIITIDVNNGITPSENFVAESETTYRMENTVTCNL